jgi:hypothetical protein
LFFANFEKFLKIFNVLIPQKKGCFGKKYIINRPKNGINNWGQLEGLLAANKDQIKDMFLLYSPIIKSKIK